MPNNRSEVSLCVKYLLFFFNVFFWLIGGLMIAIGLYARLEKTAYQEFFSDILTDPAFALIIVGAVMFVLGFSGCIGALRENNCLLKFFAVFLAIIFFLQLSLGIAAFVFQNKMEQVIVDKLQGAIQKYRDNIDLQNLIDGVQQEFKCCGGRNINDWDQNIYFNCSAPGAESCGVPFSCCKTDIINRQCGYRIRTIDTKTWETYIYSSYSHSTESTSSIQPITAQEITARPIRMVGHGTVMVNSHSHENNSINTLPVTCRRAENSVRIVVRKVYKRSTKSTRSSKIYIKGCVDAVKDWFKENLIIIGGVAVGIALLQIMGICFANSLISDIKMQKSRWNRDYPS